MIKHYKGSAVDKNVLNLKYSAWVVELFNATGRIIGVIDINYIFQNSGMVELLER
jgi:hypothetical protein